jgi:hypothetical protein
MHRAPGASSCGRRGCRTCPSCDREGRADRSRPRHPLLRELERLIGVGSSGARKQDGEMAIIDLGLGRRGREDGARIDDSVSAGRFALFEELLGRECIDDAAAAKCRRDEKSRRRARGASGVGGCAEELQLQSVHVVVVLLWLCLLLSS